MIGVMLSSDTSIARLDIFTLRRVHNAGSDVLELE